MGGHPFIRLISVAQYAPARSSTHRGHNALAISRAQSPNCEYQARRQAE